MTKQEYERLAKYEVSEEVYAAIETFYIKADLDKYQFVRKYAKIFKDFREKKELKILKVMIDITPNHCWYIVKYAWLKRIDTASGKYIIKYLTNKERTERGLDYLTYDYDCSDSQVIEAND